MTPEISRTGGGIVNGIRLTWPLVSLSVTPTTLRMRMLLAGDYHFRREDIQTLRQKWRHLWPGIQIEHTRPDLPQDLFFMPFYRPTLVRELLRLGYPVA